MAVDGDGAGADGNDGQDGNGAPSGGSPEGGSDNDALDEKFEKRIKAALASQRQRYEEQIGQVRAEFDAYKAGAGSKKQDDQPVRYTRAQLKSAVDAGQITQEQADDRWAAQVREETLEEAQRTALDVVDRQQKKGQIDSDLSAYKRLKPEIMEQGSETRTKIADEYNYLVSIGQPKSVATELAAIRAVLGPLDKLERAANSRRAADPHQDGGSGGGDSGKPKGGAGGNGKKLVDHLKGDAKEFYERGIKAGRYKDWDGVEAELKYASPSVKRRLGLPA